MVELSFLKSGSKYICEFEVSSDFNLHVEREKGGYLFLYQRSSESGNYDSVGDAKFAPQDLVVDYDCSALVYPKYIKIVSEVEPSYAAITTDGEVTEIKSQSKEVEITSNGVTEIAPDAGFGYLSGVKVNVNVPQSGGSGDAPSQPSGENSWAYLKYTGPVPSFWPPELLMLLHVVKYSYGDAVYIEPLALQQKINQTEEVKGYAINLDMKVNSYYTDHSFLSVREYIEGIGGLSVLVQFGLTEITEEEFYNIEA